MLQWRAAGTATFQSCAYRLPMTRSARPVPLWARELSLAIVSEYSLLAILRKLSSTSWTLRDDSEIAAAAAIVHRLHDATEPPEELTKAQIDALHTKLDQAEGGVKVLRWLGFTSLASAVGGLAAFYAWLKAH